MPEMTQQERDKIAIETHLMTKQTHKAVFGNGTAGIKTRMDRAEGAIAMLLVLVTAVGALGVFWNPEKKSSAASVEVAQHDLREVDD